MDFTLRPRAKDYLAEGKQRILEAIAAIVPPGARARAAFLSGHPDRGILPMLEHPDQVIRSPGTGRIAVP